MRAWRLYGVHDLAKEDLPLRLENIDVPEPAFGELLIKVSCCGICHTELDEIEGRTPPPHYPVIPGHQVVGVVAHLGAGVSRFKSGDRVGIAWISAACGQCEYCRNGQENLCNNFVATGRDRDGGYAEYVTAAEDFVYAIPEVFRDVEAAPLLCAGAIGYRALKLANLKNGQTLGLSGFGASGHLVLKLAQYLYPASPIHVYARKREEQEFACKLGAIWSGDFGDAVSLKADSIIDTTPAWSPIVASLARLKPGGRLVINAIRKIPDDQSVLLQMNYRDHLWMEKEIKSVTNITRADVNEFLALAATTGLKPNIEIYPFEEANKALQDLRNNFVNGAKVLICSQAQTDQ